MTANKHDSENTAAPSQGHAHSRRPYWRHAHRDWRVWCAAVLMIVLMLVYVLTEDLSLRPGQPATQPMPAQVAP